MVTIGGYKHIPKEHYETISKHVESLTKELKEGDRSWITKPPTELRGRDKAKLSDQDIIDIKEARAAGWTIAALVIWYEQKGRKLGWNLIQRATRRNKSSR